MRRAVWLAALYAPCGGDEGSDSANVKLGELSAAQRDDVCDSIDTRYARFEQAFVNVGCTERARAKPSSCEATRSQCIEDNDASGSLDGMIEFECQDGPSAITTTCAEITVAEMNACMDAIMAGVESLAKQFTCTASESELKPPASPKVCTSLGERCPMLAEFAVD